MKLSLAIAHLWLGTAKATALIAYWHVSGRRP